ncbi:MAG: hypothetical protein R3321_09975, partial [Nitrososphaeraceae archaeon]|nr:hypothetical protein [Nitrososphaeraceae archaeon]
SLIIFGDKKKELFCCLELYSKIWLISNLYEKNNNCFYYRSQLFKYETRWIQFYVSMYNDSKVNHNYNFIKGVKYYLISIESQ